MLFVRYHMLGRRDQKAGREGVPFVESGFLHSSPTAAASEMAEA